MDSDVAITPDPIPTTRRAVLRAGAKLGYAVPVVAATFRLSEHAAGAQVSGEPACEACPTCSVRLESGPQAQAIITVQDSDTGLASLVVADQNNVIVGITGFFVGTTDPVIVTATKILQTEPASITLIATDLDGNQEPCEATF